MRQSLAGSPRFRPPSFLVNFVQSFDQLSAAIENSENLSHAFGFRFVHHQLPARGGDVITEHRIAAGPLSFPARRAHLVAGPLTCQLAFELSKRKQNVERQTS